MKWSYFPALTASLLLVTACSNSSTLTDEQKTTLGKWYQTASVVSEVASGEELPTTLSTTSATSAYATQIQSLKKILDTTQEVSDSIASITPLIATTYQASQLWESAQTTTDKSSLPTAIYEATTALTATDADAAALDVLAVRKGEKEIVESDLYNKWKAALESSSTEAEFLSKIGSSTASHATLLKTLNANSETIVDATKEFSSVTSSSSFLAMMESLTKDSFGLTREAEDARTTLKEVSELTTEIPEKLSNLKDTVTTLITLLGSF